MPSVHLVSDTAAFKRRGALYGAATPHPRAAQAYEFVLVEL
jgi:hypothetical protein